MTRSARWASIVAASVLATSPLVAQEGEGMGSYSNPVSFGIFAGASVPLGDFSDNFAGTGFHIGGLLQWNSPTAPIGLRIDGAYHKFGNSGTSTADPSMVVGTVNGMYLFPSTSTVRPYIIGGAGVYNERCDLCDAQTKFGVNGGIGINVPLSGLSTIIEARFHYVFDKVEATATSPAISSSMFIPISVGIMFR
ncbi:MAG TPA: outer membrane beta-barrel protein [Gemmatimonadaceae bacterium]|nr:outer membrane beta-barrel protein [Gemmatimonadaceae bacterium]